MSAHIVAVSRGVPQLVLSLLIRPSLSMGTPATVIPPSDVPLLSLSGWASAAEIPFARPCLLAFPLTAFVLVTAVSMLLCRPARNAEQ